MIIRKLTLALTLFVACAAPLQAADSGILGNAREYVQHSPKSKTVAALVGGALLVIGAMYLWKCYRIKRLTDKLVITTLMLKKEILRRNQEILSKLN